MPPPKISTSKSPEPMNMAYPPTFYGKRHFADVINILKWSYYPGLAGWAQCNVIRRVLWKEECNGVTVRERCEDTLLLALKMEAESMSEGMQRSL